MAQRSSSPARAAKELEATWLATDANGAILRPLAAAAIVSPVFCYQESSDLGKSRQPAPQRTVESGQMSVSPNDRTEDRRNRKTLLSQNEWTVAFESTFW
jgi:hypothetical protein